VPAMQFPATEFVTYADQSTGVAYANRSSSSANVMFTAKDASGNVLAQGIVLAGGAQREEPGTPIRFGQFSGHGDADVVDSDSVGPLHRQSQTCWRRAVWRDGKPTHSRP